MCFGGWTPLCLIWDWLGNYEHSWWGFRKSSSISKDFLLAPNVGSLFSFDFTFVLVKKHLHFSLGFQLPTRLHLFFVPAWTLITMQTELCKSLFRIKLQYLADRHRSYTWDCGKGRGSHKQDHRDTIKAPSYNILLSAPLSALYCLLEAWIQVPSHLPLPSKITVAGSRILPCVSWIQ